MAIKIIGILLLNLALTACAAYSDNAWFLPRDCSGSEMSVSVFFDDTEIFQSRGPVCDSYENNLDGRWEKETLTVNVEPNRIITWSGYREESFDSPSDSVLEIDLWLAGADRDQSIWYIGVSVSDDDVIYMNTIHVADFDAVAESCIAPGLCIATAVN